MAVLIEALSVGYTVNIEGDSIPLALGVITLRWLVCVGRSPGLPHVLHPSLTHPD